MPLPGRDSEQVRKKEQVLVDGRGRQGSGAALLRCGGELVPSFDNNRCLKHGRRGVAVAFSQPFEQRWPVALRRSTLAR